MWAPRARSSASSGLAAANELGTGVQLNGNGLDPAHGLVAVDAARIVSGGRFKLIVVGKSRLAARPLLRAVQPMQAQRRLGCTAPDDIGANSNRLDQEFKLDSSWGLVRS